MRSRQAIRALAFTLFGAAVLFGVAAASWAEIMSTSGSPRTTTLAEPFNNTTRNVTWSVRGNDVFGAVPIPPRGVATVIDRQISSPGGMIMIDRGSVSGLQALAPLPPQMTNSANFRESLTLSRELLLRAQRAGARRLVVVRTFEQTLTVEVVVPPTFTGIPGSTTQTVVVDTRQEAIAFFLSGQIGGPFNVFRMVLRFDDGSPFRMIKQREPVRVFADLFFRGTGRLEGVWEIAEQGSTSGRPTFRIMERVVRQLGAGARVTLRGPRLPNLQPGLHLVRFRLTGNGRAVEEPLVRYQVLAGTVFAPIAVSFPPPQSLVDSSTDFAWSPVKDAAAYRLEFFDPREGRTDRRYLGGDSEAYGDLVGGGSRTGAFEVSSLRAETGHRSTGWVTGLLLPADVQQAQLTNMAWEALVPGRSYLWRVTAIAEDGSVLGASEPRPARVELPSEVETTEPVSDDVPAAP